MSTGTVPDMLPPSEGRFTKIPGPLGLASASLEGKVALVTGAGTSASSPSLIPNITLTITRPRYRTRDGS